MKKIKICGLTRLEDIEAVNIYQPDYIGFVFAGSRRQVTKEQARKLKSALSASIKAVGVFVDAPAHFVTELAQERIIDMIQLHGSETDAYIKKLKSCCPLPVIRTILKNGSTGCEGELTEGAADYLLFDSGRGSGRTFDWGEIPFTQKPYFLAGGLNLDNIGAALKTDAFALDISSGAETQGVKDKAKIKALMQIVREGRSQV